MSLFAITPSKKIVYRTGDKSIYSGVRDDGGDGSSGDDGGDVGGDGVEFDGGACSGEVYCSSIQPVNTN